MAETAEFSANVLSASKRLQILQNGSMLKFNEKARPRTVLRLPNRTASVKLQLVRLKRNHAEV